MNLRGFVVGDRILGKAGDSHADWCAGYGCLGAYRFVGGSAIGKMHLRDGRPRDDAFSVRAAGTWLAIAVSDGAGSREWSRYGASFVVECLCEHLLREVTGFSSQVPAISTQPRQQITSTEGKESSRPAVTSDLGLDSPITPSKDSDSHYGTLTWHVKASDQDQPSSPPVQALADRVRSAFQSTRQGLEQFAEQRSLALSDLHCTLLGLLLNTESGEVAAGHVGDGLIVSFGAAPAQPVVEAPTPGDPGEVYFITHNDWNSYLAVRALSAGEAQPITTFCLMTDGVAEDCQSPPPPDVFYRWTQDIDNELRKEEPLSRTAMRLLQWLASYEARGSWDDRTLVVLMRDIPNGEATNKEVP